MSAAELLVLAEAETSNYQLLAEQSRRLPWWCFRARRQLDVAAERHRRRAYGFIQQSAAVDGEAVQP